jgi:hypothetical protein
MLFAIDSSNSLGARCLYVDKASCATFTVLRIGADVKPPNLKVITPVWAQQIEVTRQGNTLLVTGWGRIPDPFDAKEIAPEHASQMDIFQRFRRYVLRHLSEKQTSKDAGVYQFADATTDEKLIAFVEEFGPVWGKVRSTKNEENGTVTITVAQSMERLRHEQEEFATATELLQQVNKKRNTHTLEDCAAITTAMLDIRLPLFSQIMIDKFLSTDGTVRQKAASILPWAHRALCLVLNECPPKLVPFDDEAIELAIVPDEGIRNAIYWQLRQDYLARRAIGTCLHCGSHFAVYKRGTRGCSEPCRRALRNQKYWNKSKATINAERRERHTGRK